MLNLVTFSVTDKNLLESSYQAIRHKDYLEIVVDDDEHQQVLQQTIHAIKIPFTVVFSFQNLFKISLPKGHFYIAQCLFDSGYPLVSRGIRSGVHQYHYQIIGIANCSIDLGATYIRPEIWPDKFADHFFHKDIDLSGTEKFNDKYYLASDNAEVIRNVFNKEFINSIGNYEGILLSTNRNEMYISLAEDINYNHCRIVEDILWNCKFLSL